MSCAANGLDLECRTRFIPRRNLLRVKSTFPNEIDASRRLLPQTFSCVRDRPQMIQAFLFYDSLLR